MAPLPLPSDAHGANYSNNAVMARAWAAFVLPSCFSLPFETVNASQEKLKYRECDNCSRSWSAEFSSMPAPSCLFLFLFSRLSRDKRPNKWRRKRRRKFTEEISDEEIYRPISWSQSRTSSVVRWSSTLELVETVFYFCRSDIKSLVDLNCWLASTVLKKERTTSLRWNVRHNGKA